MCCEFLWVILQLHDLHQAYQPSDVSGFPFKLSWAGSPWVKIHVLLDSDISWYFFSGGKTNAPTIHDDAEYSTVIDQLHNTRRTVTAVLVAIDMDQMEPYRVRVSSVIDPRLLNWSGELSFGTQVWLHWCPSALVLINSRSLALIDTQTKLSYMEASL